jgi:hypothetical protein
MHRKVCFDLSLLIQRRPISAKVFFSLNVPVLFFLCAPVLAGIPVSSFLPAVANGNRKSSSGPPAAARQGGGVKVSLPNRFNRKEAIMN